MWISRYFVYFIIYSFFGWVYESIFCTVKSAKWTNRGFLYSPVCPIYGVGGVAITIIADICYGELIPNVRYDFSWWQVFLVAFSGSIVLEYTTSWGLEKLFHAYWWDYSNMPFNIKGRVCLPYSFCFGFAGLLTVYCIAPFTKYITHWISPLGFEAAGLFFMCLISIDTTLTVSALTSFEHTVSSFEENLNAHLEQLVESTERMVQSMGNYSKAALRRVKGFRKSKKTDVHRLEAALSYLKGHVNRIKNK